MTSRYVCMVKPVMCWQVSDGVLYIVWTKP
jgi:hypothetical protein